MLCYILNVFCGYGYFASNIFLLTFLLGCLFLSDLSCLSFDTVLFRPCTFFFNLLCSCFSCYPFFFCLSQSLFLHSHYVSILLSLWCDNFLMLIKHFGLFSTMRFSVQLCTIYVETLSPPLPHFLLFSCWRFLWWQKKEKATAQVDKGLKGRFSHIRELILEEQSQATKIRKRNRYDKFEFHSIMTVVFNDHHKTNIKPS